MKLYAESIPHLFHWDLAYLWILEKEPHLRPETWEERVRAWKYLVSLLLTSELEVEEEPIVAPFLAYTQPYGLTRVSWVRLRNSPVKVGVLSPTVLVRPLPDYKRGELSHWAQSIAEPETSRGIELSHFIQLAVQSLKQGQRPDSYRARISSVLEKEFKSAAMPNPPGGAYRQVPIINQVVWSQDPGETGIEYTNILVQGGTRDDSMIYVPKCERCLLPLTRALGAEPVYVEEQEFTVTCESPGCGQTNTLRLSDFLIWARDGAEVIVWDKQNLFTRPEKGFPPKPAFDGVEVRFEWGPAQLNAEATRRYLRLHFSGKEVRERKLDDIFFKKVLVPGSLKDFTGLPLRHEWFDALEDPRRVKIEPDVNTPKLTYRGLKIRGLPSPVDKTFASLSIRAEPGLGVGIYPNPALLPEGWRWFRTFLHGSNREQYQLEAASANRILPWLAETHDEFPETFSVLSTADGVGVTYHRERTSGNFLEGIQSKLHVGIDFGTTNSIVYSMPPGETADTPRPDKYGLRPSSFSGATLWLAEAEGSSSEDAVADFLPAPRYGENRPDPYIIPSALWQVGDRFIIRWSSKPPTPGAVAVSGFKWNRGLDYSAHRRAYLEEILFLILPNIIRTSGLTSSNAKFHLGFSFPLAFNFISRQGMQELLDDIDTEMQNRVGFTFESYSISESWACVRAFGTPNPGETFLVADMGGGTMDLALFTVGQHQTIDTHQIGSVQFAGESYVNSLVEKKRPNPSVQDKFRWELKDLISSGRAYEHYGHDQDAQTILHRFGGMAFEYLRTVIDAHRQPSAGRPAATEQPKPIHLVLVGNGWHLADTFSAETPERSPKNVFQEHYTHLTMRLGIPSLSLYEGEPLPLLPSSKHLVVIGALRNTLSSQAKKELTQTTGFSMLPSGRAMKFRTTQNREIPFAWHDLIGEKFPLPEYAKDELTGGRLDFDLRQMPPLSDSWKSQLLSIFRVQDLKDLPYPSDQRLREQIFNSIQGLSSPKIGKGPLQVILETFWIEYLKQ